MSIVVNIHNEGGFDSIPKEKTKIIVEQLLADYNIKEANFNIIYLNDKEIHEINKQYLQHDYPTDVITFVIDEENTESDIYIGVETAEENAKEYGATLESELLRLAIHGSLHVVGFDDKTEEEREKMHQLENLYLERVDG